MTSDYSTYRDLLTINGETRHERDIDRAKSDFLLYAPDNPGYVADATRNGVTQRFLITRSEVQYKYNITAFPDEELYPGDEIECYGQHWLVINTRVGNPVQTTGIMWMCNYEFAFQNFDSTIHKYWGVLDSGVYSTTRTSDPYIQTLNQQYRVYLPYNDYTKLIHEDKRLAVGKWNDKHNDDILTVYEVTGRDYIAKDYGDGAHLLVLNVKGSQYNEDTDNFELGICDYISAQDVPTTTGTCRIVGMMSVRAGMKRKYVAKFYNASGTEVTGLTPVWGNTSTATGYTAQVVDGNYILTLSDSTALVGATITISLSETSGVYGSDTMKVEVSS